MPEAKAGGQRAIEVLGSNLPAVAAHYRKSPDELASLLRNDRRAKIDRHGKLFFEDELDAPLPATPASSMKMRFGAASASSAVADPIGGTLSPMSDTFLLHSKPGAKRTIYLNFKGATLTGTAWNSSSATIQAVAFDLDGIPGTFSDAELQRIQYIWQRVVEDYAAFDVDVTTEAPTVDALTRGSTSDDVYGTTVLITSRTGVYSCSCGGVAYVGVFDSVGDYYKPALVFYDALGSGNEKYVAEAISHEAGHNMGLSHDGTASASYYQGQGSGTYTGWAPIMGVGYYKPLVQWSKGEYSGANNTEDDFVVMAQNGLALRTDDHGSTLGTATVLANSSSGGTTTFTSTGVIGSASDVDYFSFTAAAGPVTISLATAMRSANFDALIELRNSADQVIATANPLDALNATITATLPAVGSYYVTVRGTGQGSASVDGYSRYGSVGQYALTVSALTATGQAPLAQLTATPISGTVPLTVQLSGANSTDADGSIVAYQWVFGDGTTGTGATVSHVYSTAGTYTAQLTVTDNSGMSASKSTTITVQPQVQTITMNVSNIAMGLQANRNRARATATVRVLDASGNAVNGATVTGTWSGVVSGSVSGATSSGSVTLSSPQTTRTSGVFTFTVTGITLSGYSYNPQGNIETSDSITY